MNEAVKGSRPIVYWFFLHGMLEQKIQGQFVSHNHLVGVIQEIRQQNTLAEAIISVYNAIVYLSFI